MRHFWKSSSFLVVTGVCDEKGYKMVTILFQNLYQSVTLFFEKNRMIFKNIKVL